MPVRAKLDAAYDAALTVSAVAESPLRAGPDCQRSACRKFLKAELKGSAQLKYDPS